MRHRALLVAIAIVASACGGDSGGDGAAGNDDQAEVSAVPDSSSVDVGDDSTAPIESGGVQVATEDEVVAGYSYVTTTLDPHQAPTRAAGSSLYPLYDSLVRIAPETMKIEPMLASDWKFTRGNTRLALTIRDDVSFVDGARLDADAVKANLERAAELPESTVADRLDSVESIVVEDRYRLVLELAEPDPGLLNALGEFPGMMISPRAIEEGVDLAAEAVGTGPYSVVQFAPGQELVYELRDDYNYWDPDAWRIRRLRAVFAGDPQSALNAVRAGDWDFSAVSLPDDVLKGALGDDLQYRTVDSRTLYVLYLSGASSAWDDPDVRTALAKGIDRRTIAEAVAGRPYAELPFTAGVPGYVDGSDPYPYDPDLAREALSDGGVEGGVEIAYVSPGSAVWVSVTEAIQQELQGLGVDVNLTALPAADAIRELREGTVSALSFPMPQYSHPVATLEWLAAGYGEAAGLQYGPELDELNRLLGKVNAAEPGTPEEHDAITAAVAYAAELAYWIPIYHDRQPYVANQRFRNFDDAEVLDWAGLIDPRYWSFD